MCVEIKDSSFFHLESHSHDYIKQNQQNSMRCGHLGLKGSICTCLMPCLFIFSLLSFSQFHTADVMMHLRSSSTNANHNIYLTHSPRVWKTPVSFPNKLDKLLTENHNRNAQVMMQLFKNTNVLLKWIQW